MHNKKKDYQFMDVLENLALLMIINKEIDVYLANYDHTNSTMMRSIFDKEDQVKSNTLKNKM